METPKDTAYYVVVYGYDTDKRSNCTLEAVVTLTGDTIHSVEGLQSIKKMIEEDLKVTNVCIMNQIELTTVPAAGVFRL